MIQDALITYRLTKVLTEDKIAEPIRERVPERLGALRYLVRCFDCASVWIGWLVALRRGKRGFLRRGLVNSALAILISRLGGG